MSHKHRSEHSLSQIDLKNIINSSQKRYHPSPYAWEDQVLYFLMLDRFSDGNEKDFLDNKGKPVTTGKTPLFTEKDYGNAVLSEEDAFTWRESGSRWVGGTLKGLESKMGYLSRMGFTAVWISPIFRQVAFQETYHGYGIQNFLDVDPHFGTREDLQSLVKTAHSHGIYIILDVILNHSGNVFSYQINLQRYPHRTDDGKVIMDARWDGNLYPVQGFNDRNGEPSISFIPGPLNGVDASDAIWPQEFQHPDIFQQKGRISSWDHYPEYVEGDFFDLKEIKLGSGNLDNYSPSPALKFLCEVYKFWIAETDIDGFRVDTVKHMDKGAARYFTSVIHEFTQAIGKENFYLIGEITGGRQNAFTTLEETGMNAALGIDDIPSKIEETVKGYADPIGYFNLFRNSELVQKESHVWFRDKVVTLFDDHDQVRKGEKKARFCAYSNDWQKLVVNAMAFNVLTMGIPCIYYGTEQCFDGEGGSDRYIREAMFGGEFGAFRSKNRHFFNEQTPAYKEISKISKIRKQELALRRGRQYLRQISGNGIDFGFPQKIGDRMLSVLPWSRIFSDTEILCAINTDPNNSRSAWVVIDKDLHKIGDFLTCLYSSDPGQTGSKIEVTEKNTMTAVLLTVPAAGCVIFK